MKKGTKREGGSGEGRQVKRMQKELQKQEEKKGDIYRQRKERWEGNMRGKERDTGLQVE